MTLRHPGISPTNDLVAKKIFSNPEITCQFIRDMLDLAAKNVTILEGSNIHVLPSMPYSAQDFYTSIDVLAELDNGTQVIIEIQVHHQNFFINRLWAYLCSQVNQNLEKIRQREGDTHQSYKHIAPVYAIAIVDSNYFSDDLAFHSFSMREDTTGEVLTITNPSEPSVKQTNCWTTRAGLRRTGRCLVNYGCVKNKHYWLMIMPWKLLGRRVSNKDWSKDEQRVSKRD